MLVFTKDSQKFVRAEHLHRVVTPFRGHSPDFQVLLATRYPAFASLGLYYIGGTHINLLPNWTIINPIVFHQGVTAVYLPAELS